MLTPWSSLLKVRFGFPELYFGTQILEEYWTTLEKHPRKDRGFIATTDSFHNALKVAEQMSVKNGGDNKHSSAKYNKSESNLISSPKNLACSSIAASNCGSPTSSSLLAIIDR